MIRGVTPAVALLLLSASAAAQPSVAAKRQLHDRRARLDPATRTITGTETIVWRNITATTSRPNCSSTLLERLEETRASTFMRERALGAAAIRPRTRAPTTGAESTSPRFG